MTNSRTMDSSVKIVEESNLIAKKTSVWADFLALIKIGIINSNLMTTFAGIWLALHFTGKEFFASIDLVLLAMFGTAFTIAGGCVLNNYVDRDIDHVMERTQTRPTVTGTIPLKIVLVLGLVFSFIGISLLYIASLPAALAGFVGLFTYVVLYTMWTKRKYTLNTVVGSISGAAPPLIGWAAIDPALHPMAWILFVLMFLWQPPHFLALAMRKCEEYRNAGVPMLPVVHGFEMTKRQIIVYTLCLLPIPFYMQSLGMFFVTVATLLTVGWVILGFAHFKMKNDLKWAKYMFVYSLNYLTILFILMIVVTLF